MSTTDAPLGPQPPPSPARSGPSLRLVLIVLGVLLALAVVVAVIVVRWTRLAAGTVAKRPATTTQDDSFSARNWAFHLRAVPGVEPEVAAADAWRGLMPGLAADAESQALLRRLYGGLPVEFAVLDPTDATDAALAAPPSAGHPIALRVSDLGSKTETYGGRSVEMGLIALGRASRLERPVAVGDVPGAILRAMDSPDDGEVFMLIAEDYLLRHASGWVLIGGPFTHFNEPLPASLDAQRADLDRRIHDHATKAAAYYRADPARR